ncbi:uncharacterized protein LOC121389035 [Gigantopelta aegis]|uniref:uncharacterized protein LOC121389035 n=1 Tax=Gigantopelta aegis TaxID=1735272 RepID=UPI001B88DFA6|nr:uncharacterized protein LOC121389035 [Gigantopelta aegis]
MVHVVTCDVVVVVLMLLWSLSDCQNSANELAPLDVRTSSTDYPTLVNDTTLNVTLQIADTHGSVLGRASLPFGMAVKLKIESSNINKTFVAVPVQCHLVSVNSKRRYAILKNGCGDGIVMSKTDGFAIYNGTGFSSAFRALDFSTNNRIKFSCNVVFRKYVDTITTCNNSSSAALTTSGRVEHFRDVNAKIQYMIKGNNSGMFTFVETRVVGLTFAEQLIASKLKRGDLALSQNGTTSPTDVKYQDDSLHARRLIFILAFCGFYLFILAVFISIQIDRNKLESMRKPIL